MMTHAVRIFVLLQVILQVYEALWKTPSDNWLPLGGSELAQAGIIACVCLVFFELSAGMTKIQNALRRAGEKSTIVNLFAWFDRLIRKTG
jgi:hypothetical protein